jgi:uncharacterized glyoxalase superfamily protein PhnB
MLSPILSVQDIDDSIDFYVRKLGFSHNWSLPGADGKTNLASVKLGQVEILLGTIDFVAPEDIRKRGTGIQMYINLPNEMNIDAIYERARGSGANITREIEDRDWGERTFSVKDGDGYHYMFAQRLPRQTDAEH